MPQILLRLEKEMPKDSVSPARTMYFEFQLMSGNRVLRLWPLYENGRPMSLKEMENFQSAEDMKAYIKNARDQHEANGYKAVSGEWLGKAVSEKPSKVRSSEKPSTTKPVVSKNPSMGELPAPALTPGSLE